MNRTTPSSEAALCAAYRDQAECYRQAVALVESLPGLLRAGGEAHAEPLSRVMVLLAEVAAIEARVRAVKDQWVSAGSRPGSELRAVLADVMQLIERLARSLAAAEEEAAAQKARLAPQVDTMIRGRAMRRAYGVA